MQSNVLQGNFLKKAAGMDPGSGQASNSTFPEDMLPQSPEAEAMAKYALMPVTLYSGLPQISVPIFTLKTHNLTVPVSLSYNYNGFRPAEVATSVGLGWSVQGGGVVTRIVKSRVDHLDPDVTGNDYDNFININEMSNKQVILQDMGLNTMDGEPDIYVFNAPGLSGRFILMQGRAYLFPCQDIQVQWMGGQTGFIITNQKGDKYYFTAQENSHHKQTSAFSEFVPNHVSAWFLSQIISADLTDTVTYTYTPYTFTQPPVLGQTLTTSITGSASATRTTVTAQTLAQTNAGGDSIASVVLSGIFTNKGESISFTPDTAARRDNFVLFGAMHALSKVTITSGNSALQKQFNLLHAYYNGKLNLTGVDITAPAGSSPDTALTQHYRFQYINQDTSMTAIPGWNNQSIDYWGYYNGADNQTLFTPADIGWLQSWSYGNREPNLIYGDYNALSQITYPTGGYTQFIYQQNQSGALTYDLGYTIDTLNIASDYYDDPGMSGFPLVNGTRTVTGSFSLNVGQTVYLHYDLTDLIDPQPDPILKIYAGGLNGALMFTSPPVTPQVVGIDSIYLPPGTYSYGITADSLVDGVSGAIIYKNYPPDNTLTPAPGICVKQITSYDNINSSPALTKQYAYNFGVGLYTTGARSFCVIQYGSLCQPENSCGPLIQTNTYIYTQQAGMNGALNDLITNQFFYADVQETTIGNGSNGMTDYQFNCFAPGDPTVFLKTKTDYTYINSRYIPVQQVASNYQLVRKWDFQTLTSSVVGQSYPGNGCYLCNLPPTPDQTQPVAGLINIYGATHGDMPSGYKSLQSTVNTIWDTKGQNPVISETDYYYDNPNYLLPTREVTHDSKGQQITTTLKYPLDYPVAGALSLAGVDSVYINGINSVNLGYNLCYDSLLTALHPYQPYANINPTEFTTIANSYNCENEYKANSQTIYNTLNTNRSNYYAGLSSAQSTDTAVWHKALYWMQTNNVVNPVIEKYVTLLGSDGNQYVLSATKNNYSLLSSPSGQLVAKQTGFLATELSAPLLETTFLGNTGNYYANEFTLTYDSLLCLSTQTKVNDLTHHYVWGVDHQFVVADIIGSTQSAIAPLVNQPVLDDPSTSLPGMLSALNAIRTGLAGTKALVTTYTYDALLGITSKTDPAGHTTYYDYDIFGRLMDIKDQDGNMVKTFSYHYQGH